MEQNEFAEWSVLTGCHWLREGNGKKKGRNGQIPLGMEEQRAWNGLTTIHFYLREGYFGSALSECEKRLIESNEPHLAILRGLTLVFLERRSEGLRLLEGAKEGPCALGALYALRVAHGRTAKTDKESQRMVETEIAKTLKDATPEALISAIEVLILSGTTNGVKPLLDRAMAATGGSNAQVPNLIGWFEVSSGGNQNTAQKAFEKAAGMGYPDGYLGRVQILEKRRATPEMRIVAKELTTSNVRLIPGHIVSIKADIADREWENAGQMVKNTLLLQEDSVYLLFLKAVHSIVYKGSEIEEATGALSAHFDKVEKGNGPLAFSYAQFFTRIALKNGSVTKLARKMLEKAIVVSPSLTEYSVLAFRLFVALGDEKEATNRAKQLVKTESDDPYALLSMVICSLMAGNIRDAQSHLSFVKEAHAKIKKSPLFHFLDAVCARYSSNGSFDSFLAASKTAIEEQFATVQGVAYGIDGIFTLDVDFLVGIVYQMMDFAPISPVKGNDPILKEVERVLTSINEYCPGLPDVNYLLARVKWLLGQTEIAERLVEELARGTDATAEVFLLKAQIKIDKGRMDEAESALDTGLSQSFAVRDSPLFHLIKVKVQKKRNDHERAVEALRKVIGGETKNVGSNLLARREKDEGHRISLYLELIDSLQTLGRTREADTVMSEALNRWKGTEQEEQLIIMNAQLHVGKGDADAALAILSTVKTNQSNYQAARMKMAEIYLEEKKDKTMFTKMFKELMMNDTTPATYALLGDAYMSVQNPKQAIQVYEKALKANPKDHALAEKIGEAYVQCHLYTKAVNYYEAAVKSGRDSTMRTNLANLLYKMGNYEKCERVLMDPLNKETNPTEVASHAYVQYYLLLAKVHHEKGQFEKVNEDLTAAKKIQLKLMHKNHEGSVGLQLKKECAKICCQIAEMHHLSRDVIKTIEAYKEALVHNDADIKIHLALAQTYLSSGRHDLCHKECQVITNIDKNNIEAILMAADIKYSRSELAEAMIRFDKVLEQLPNNYHALSRFIELSWREGTIVNADNRLRNAMINNPRATVDPGYNYCKGIHEWYSGNMNNALQCFNRARKDLEWGEKAIYNIVEVLLNPENDIVGVSNNEDDSEESTNSTTAARFLGELRADNAPDSKYALHTTMIMMASGEKQKVQEALEKFLMMALEKDPGGDKVRNVGAVLGAARAYVALKLVPKAKQLLKRVMDFPWTLTDAEHLEMCWLLLAEIYTNQTKPEQAKVLIMKVIHVNKSSIKAYELMAYLFEKDGKWTDAVYNYEKAWGFGRERNPVIGYKLAFNMLKAKKNFDCIIVCQKVLSQFPTYPKIRKELMEKARMNIRT